MNSECFQLVNRVLYKMRRRLLLQRADIDLDDYRQIGMLGHVKAQQGFDPNKGVFVPYATRRISGEIIDWNRKLGPRCEDNRVQTVYMEDLAGHQWLDMKNQSAEELFLRKEEHERIRELLSTMRDCHRRVLTHYYFEGKNLKEIGKLYGLTESRMCQIINGARRCLQQKLGGMKMPPKGSKGWKRDPATKQWLPPVTTVVAESSLINAVGVPVIDKAVQRQKRKKENTVVATTRQEVELVIKLKFIVEVV